MTPAMARKDDPMNRFALTTALALLLVGCGGTASKEEIAEGEDKVHGALQTVNRGRTLLEILGILPSYTCGEPRRDFVGRLAENVSKNLGCAQVATSAQSDFADAVTVTFPAGCKLGDHELGGELALLYSGGIDRFDASIDFSTMTIDGELVPANGGYQTCGDQSQYWGHATGTLVRNPFLIDFKLTKVDGIMLLGQSTLYLDGRAAIETQRGTDEAVFRELTYKAGDKSPSGGELVIAWPEHQLVARFYEASGIFSTGQLELIVDDKDPVKLPIPQ